MTTKKEIFGWCMYDFANTIFSALFTTIYFPLIVILKGGTVFHIGLIVSIAMISAALFVPYLGAIADITKRKKPMLFIFTLLCCIATLFSGYFDLKTTLIFGFLAKFFFNASLDIYDSILVDISNKRNISFISGLGISIGYLGTIFGVLIAYTAGKFYGHETLLGVQVVFVLIAIMFLGFSLFTFIFVKEPSGFIIKKDYIKTAFYNVTNTIKNIKKFRHTWLFLLASFFYSDAANTALGFLYLYATNQIGVELTKFLPIYISMAITAAVGSLFFGKISDKFGHKRILTFILIMWILIILVLYLKTTYTTFLIIGLVGGALLGGLWALTRTLLVDLTPKNKQAELFGYQGLTEKISGVIGPVLFGYIALILGFRQALWVIIVLFLIGLIFLRFVKVNKYSYSKNGNL
ncbi:MFS transporter [Candidatus Woesearchaeota archaeon]|nr:MFS transporter [Candidatus Woesearchaeota archaeon]